MQSENLFSSPIFGDMFLLQVIHEYLKYLVAFSSPIFGDMFLLKVSKLTTPNRWKVFVSYIRRYVLTPNAMFNVDGLPLKFSSPIFGDMFLLLQLLVWFWYELCFRLLYSEICSYLQT